MNILLCGDCDNGGASWFFADAINRYTTYTARAVRGYQSYLDYPYDVLGPSVDEYKALVRWADVVHIRDRPPHSINLDDKTVVITYTGRIFRQGEDAVYKAHKKGWTICVVTADMLAFCPEVSPIWLPNPRDDLQDMVQPTKAFSVCQAPTSRSAKQTEKVIKACRQAEIPLTLVEQTSYAECLRQKATAWVVIDQLKYGYGNNAIEAWSMGLPVVSGFFPGQPYRAAVIRACGELPFAEATPSAASIRNTLERLRDDQDYYDEMVERGRNHFWGFHYAPVIAARAIEIYEQAREREHG